MQQLRRKQIMKKKLKQIIIMTTVAVLVSVPVLPLTVSAADPLDTKTGTTAIALTADPSALTLDQVPSFAWGSHKVSDASGTPRIIGATGYLSVMDARGGDNSYHVTALASEMKDGVKILPISMMTISTTASSPLTSYTDVNILAAGKILVGNVGANGRRTATATGKIKVEPSAKVGSYTGTITYSIIDGLT
jgi:hypothetical protein